MGSHMVTIYSTTRKMMIRFQTCSIMIHLIIKWLITMIKNYQEMFK